MQPADDDRPRRGPAHVLGEDLAALSLDELAARIAVLRAEIARIEEAIGAKQASAAAADAFFRR
ncbi:MAG: DUF1192 domain-containing protein [Rhizobiales bacterium]|jgi:uncharacterized small protein (DUF1192 family)|nr:DUF1192 domain-containing protein [Hyphomicrobiales bacterium]